MATFVMAVSCSSDDAPGLIEVGIDPAEETVLDAALVSQNVIISGAAKINGAAPTPTGSTDFTLSSNVQSAFQKNGFDIVFEGPTNFAGAYIQIKSEDGTLAPDYFDVPVTSTFKGVENKDTKKSSKFLSQSTQKVENSVTIDVDFGNGVPPGKFCYILCIYDDQGNISQPQEVCVEVEAWGGNPNLIGTWNYVKEIADGVTYLAGQEFCDDEEFFQCSNGTQIFVENAYCETINSLPLIFNEDGTYGYTSDETYTNFNYQETYSTCSVSYEATVNGSYSSAGNWAYDEEEGRLTLVEFSFTEGGQTDPIPDGELLYDGAVSLSSSSLIIKESEIYEGVTENYEYHFAKQ